MIHIDHKNVSKFSIWCVLINNRTCYHWYNERISNIVEAWFSLEHVGWLRKYKVTSSTRLYIACSLYLVPYIRTYDRNICKGIPRFNTYLFFTQIRNLTFISYAY